MASRLRTSTERLHSRFVRVVARAFARPLSDFKSLPVRPKYHKPRGTSAKSENENPYFHSDEAGA